MDVDNPGKHGPEGISYDIDNPMYRQLKAGDTLLEYSVDGGKLAVDFLEGKNAIALLKEVIDAEGSVIRTIEGYVTDVLAKRLPSDRALLLYGRQTARELGGLGQFQFGMKGFNDSLHLRDSCHER